MRLILDANIFVSALITPKGICGQILNGVLKNPGIFEVIMTEKIILEIITSLSKPRVMRYSKKNIQESTMWIEDISAFTTIVPDIPLSFSECRDPDDVVYLSAAHTAKADLIVSGDKDLLVLKRYHGTEIVSPGNFIFAIRQMF
jgi:putative PIN family toxin of toxin-antitoxin system